MVFRPVIYNGFKFCVTTSNFQTLCTVRSALLTFNNCKQIIFQKIQSFIKNSSEDYDNFGIHTRIPGRDKELCDSIKEGIELKKEQEFELCLDDFKKGLANKKFQRICAVKIDKFILWLKQNKHIIFNANYEERLKYLADVIFYANLNNDVICDFVEIVIESMKEKNHAKEVYYFISEISKDRDNYPFDKSVEILSKKTKSLAK